ncbi:hypothetical protein [Hymenobacter sp.]|uniref:hypothetical protein n=1 Tax=Hymenobacter sp. TaxID=1898978 RepID=UPI00286B5111|nr:hypothetical protein [Hymenobacter sp.]
MNLFRTLSGAAVLCLTSAGLNSCINAPDYAEEPTITFKEVRVTHVPAGIEIATDTLEFVLDYRDGDGDLGLDPDDLLNPPFFQESGAPRNRNSYNYFIQPLARNLAGVFVPYLIPGTRLGDYDGRFPRLVEATDTKAAPIRGTMRYKLPLSLDGVSYFEGQVLKFEISILDRKLHESNKITTSEVRLGL